MDALTPEAARQLVQQMREGLARLEAHLLSVPTDEVSLGEPAEGAEIERWRAEADRGCRLREKLWPAWLLTAPLGEWFAKLEEAAGASTATPAALLLLAALHGCTAAAQESDPKLLFDTLRELSRRLFVWLKEQTESEPAALQAATSWAVAINSDLAGRGEVEIPTLGAPATSQWMIFRPRPGTNSPDVLSVQTWCVRNAQKQPIHRAEVTV